MARDTEKKDVYTGAGAEKKAYVNPNGPDSAQACIAEADPRVNGGITNYPMKPKTGRTA